MDGDGQGKRECEDGRRVAGRRRLGVYVCHLVSPSVSVGEADDGQRKERKWNRSDATMPATRAAGLTKNKDEVRDKIMKQELWNKNGNKMEVENYNIERCKRGTTGESLKE